MFNTTTLTRYLTNFISYNYPYSNVNIFAILKINILEVLAKLVIEIKEKQSIVEIEKSFSIIEEFLKKKKKEGKSENLVRNYRYDLVNFLKCTNIQDLDKIIVEDLELYIEIMRNRNCSGSTINRRISAIKSCITYLMRDKRRILRRKRRIGQDKGFEVEELRTQIEEYEDILDFESVKAVKQVKLPFSVDEVKNILKTIEELKTYRYIGHNYRDYLIIKFSVVGTGARNTAVRKLVKQDLDCYYCSKKCKDCIPTVKLLRKGKTETNQEERSKIQVQIQKDFCKEMYDFIHDKKHTSDIVFQSRNSGELSIVSMNRILYKILELAGIEKKGRTFHSLRHTFITEGIKNGTPYGAMARQVDHEGKLGITGKYDHVDPKDLDIHFIEL